MKYKIYDKTYNFYYMFDTETGTYVRSGVLNSIGNDTGLDPFMGSFPHLIDIGIMGHCEHGKSKLCINSGVECYQDGLNKVEKNMNLLQFESILKQCYKKTNQVALGGRGDPDQHENFEQILKITKKYGVVPNYTTSGLGMNDQIAKLTKKYCGAVAVSWYRSEYTYDSIINLIQYGNTVNIHYVLSKSSIDEAINRLQNNSFPKGINAVIFLLHKPKGLGSMDNVLQVDDSRINVLLGIVDDNRLPFDIGFDSCSVPALINQSKNIIKESIEPCEAARFSCYVSSNMVMTPCSFDTELHYGVSLKEHTIAEAWNSDLFNSLRELYLSRCKGCKKVINCLGGCPLIPEIILCKNEERLKEGV